MYCCFEFDLICCFFCYRTYCILHIKSVKCFPSVYLLLLQFIYTTVYMYYCFEFVFSLLSNLLHTAQKVSLLTAWPHKFEDWTLFLKGGVVFLPRFVTIMINRFVLLLSCLKAPAIESSVSLLWLELQATDWGEKNNTPTRVHHIKHICIAASPKTLLCVDLHLRKQNVFVEVSVIGSILLFKQEDGCWGWKHDNQLHHLRRSCTVVFLTPVLCADSHRRQKWPDLVWRR